MKQLSLLLLFCGFCTSTIMKIIMHINTDYLLRLVSFSPKHQNCLCWPERIQAHIHLVCECIEVNSFWYLYLVSLTKWQICSLFDDYIASDVSCLSWVHCLFVAISWNCLDILQWYLTVLGILGLECSVARLGYAKGGRIGFRELCC